MLDRRPWLVWILVGIGYAAVMTLLFWRVLFRHQMAGWDSIDEYWPDLIYQARAYTDGELPLWNPYTNGGYSFYADPQASQLAPVNLMCVMLSPLIGTGAWLMELKLLLLFYLVLWGMHLLVHRWTGCHVAGLVAAIVFVVGAPTLVHKNGALLWPMLYLPWAVLALEAYFARPSLRRGVILGTAVGATGAGGHPQGFFYAALILLAVVAYHAVADAITIMRAHRVVPIGAALGQRLRRFAASGVLAVVIAGLWLWAVYGPAAAVVEGSDREVRTLGWVLGNPLNVAGLRELFVPNLDTNWSHDIYLGPLAIVLVAWWAVRSWPGRLWLVVAALATVLALGVHSVVLPALVQHVPGFDLFRIPYRYKLITGFACACGVGLAVGHLATQAAEVRNRDRIVVAALSLGWLGAAFVIGPTQATLVAGLVLAALLALLFDRAPRRRRVWLGLLVVLTLVDLWRANDSKLAILQPVPDADKGIAVLDRLDGIDARYRFWVGDRDSGRPGAIPQAAAYRADYREISGFEQPLTPKRSIDLLAAAKKTPAVLLHFNVKYFLSRSPGQGAAIVKDTPFFAAEDVAPVVRVYPRAEALPAKAQLDRMRTTSPSSLVTALIDPRDPTPVLPTSTFAPIDGRVLGFGRNAITLTVDAPADGIAVINEVWAPGWTATIDGTPTPIFRANYMLRGVVVPAGTHRIAMHYTAPTYRRVLLALLAFVVGFVVLCLLRPRWWDRPHALTEDDHVVDRVVDPMIRARDQA